MGRVEDGGEHAESRGDLCWRTSNRIVKAVASVAQRLVTASIVDSAAVGGVIAVAEVQSGNIRKLVLDPAHPRCDISTRLALRRSEFLRQRRSEHGTVMFIHSLEAAELRPA